MNESEIHDVVSELLDRHPQVLTWRLDDLARTLGLLPESGVWRIAELTPAVVALAPNDRVFTISIKQGTAEKPAEQEPAEVTMITRPVEGHRIIASFAWGEWSTRSNGVWRETHWTFRYPAQTDDQLDEWQRITGMVRFSPSPELHDRNEQYARALFAAIGRVVGKIEDDEIIRVEPPQDA